MDQSSHSSLFNFFTSLKCLIAHQTFEAGFWNLYDPVSLVRELPRGSAHPWHLGTFDHSRMYRRSEGIKRLIKKRYSRPLIFMPFFSIDLEQISRLGSTF